MELEIISIKKDNCSRDRPLLFLHGAAHSASCWSFFQSYFSDLGYETHALSLRGHGNSSGHEDIHTHRISDYIEDLTLAIEQFKTPPVLIGHSMGAYIILKYLENNKAPGAIILAPIPVCGTFKITLQIALINPRAFLKFVLTGDFYSVISTPQLSQNLFFSANITEDQLHHNFSLLQTESLRACLDTMHPFNLRPARITKSPFLFLGAMNDAVISQQDVLRTAKAYGSHAEFIPEIAHDLMLENNWQVVAARINDWLNETSGETP